MSGTLAIPASQIVQVTPSVLSAGGTGLDLQGLFLTTSPRVPTGTVLAFPNLLAVRQFFGASSQEAAIGQTYFLAFDNSNIKPASILFTQYNLADVGAWSRGASLSGMTVSQLQAIPTGTLTVMIDGVSTTSGPITLGGATSFSGAAEAISLALGLQGPQSASFQGAITNTTLSVTAMTPGGMINIGDQLAGTGVTAGTTIVAQTAGTPGRDGTYTIDDSQSVAAPIAMTTNRPVVSFDPVSFAFVTASATTGADSSITAPTGPIAVALHMDAPSGAIVSQGAVAASPTEFMTEVTAFTQNWASFTTLFDPDAGSGNAVKQEFAAWVNGTIDNYLYAAWDTDPTPTETTEATTSLGAILDLSQSSGTACIYSPLQGPTIAAFLMGSIAAIDFTQFNGRKTMAFRQQSGVAPDVVSGTVAANLEANTYNYYGNWATANDEFTFFYPGSLTGPFDWIDSYVNQIWMNNQFQLALMELLFNAGSIPYNQAGYTLIKAACQDVINQALDFGAIRTGVTLSQAQIAEVNASAGVAIDGLLFTQGYYLQVRDATPQVRQARGSPPCSFWYCDGGSVQRIDLASIMIQ